MSRPPQCPVVQQLRPVSVAPRPELAELREAAYCLVVDADGSRIPFGALYRRQKAIVVFVRVRRAAAGRNGAALRAVHTCGSAGLCVRTCLRLCRCMCG